MDSLFSFFLSPSIRQRIGLGFAGMLLLLVVLAGGAMYVLRDLGQRMTAFQSTANDAALVSSIDRDMATLQRQVREFLSTGRQEMPPRIEALYQSIKAEIAVAGNATASAESADAFRKIAVAADSYQSGFARIVELMLRRDDIVGKRLNPALDVMRQKLAEINQSASAAEDFENAYYAGVVQEKLSTLRAQQARFLITSDDQVDKDARATIADLYRSGTDLVSKLNDAEQLAGAKAILGQLPPYEKSFTEMVGAVKQRDKLAVDVLDKGGQDTAAQATAITKAAEKQATTLGVDTHDALAQSQRVGFVVVLVGLVLAAILAWFISRAITSPINRMTKLMERLAKGDHRAEVAGLERRDEIGTMARAVEVFKHGLIEADRLRAEQKAAEARAGEERRAGMHKLADGFERSVRGMVQAVSAAGVEMRASAESMSAIAEETSRRSTAMSSTFAQASANIHTVASAAEELAGSIDEISRQVTQSTSIAGRAVADASAINGRVQSLSDAAARIGDVISLINTIASQTNLLALNAAIEAARAGEAGKGFAVVASEVKTLATQTAKATDDISAQIATIQGATRDAVSAIRSIAGTIGEINEIATSIATAVSQQGAATQEISRNVQKAAVGTSDIASEIAGVLQAADQTGKSATSVLAAAADLSRQSEELSGEVDGFLSSVRSA